MDGLAAAWALRKKFPDAAVEFASYGQPAPKPVDKHVIIADFSYDRDTLLELARHNKSILVLDHHKSAEAALANVTDWDTTGRIMTVFSMDFSGAQIVENFYQLPKSRVVAYVGDRDLWKFELPNSKEINALLSSREPTFEWLDQAEVLLNTNFPTAQVMGTVIYEYQLGVARKQAKRFTLRQDAHGRRLGLANITTLISETADVALSTGAFDYVISFFDTTDTNQRVYSLRSKGEVDVSLIAKEHGGGGHKNAAGYTTGRPT